METNTNKQQNYSWCYTIKDYYEHVKQTYTTYDENGVKIVFSVESESKRKVIFTSE